MMAAGVTVAEIAEALGAQHATARAYRLDPDATGYRNPPHGWEEVFSRLAKERCPDLKRVAELGGGVVGE